MPQAFNLTVSLCGVGCRRLQRRYIQSPRCIVPKVQGSHKAGDRGDHVDDCCPSRPCCGRRTHAQLRFFIRCHAMYSMARDRLPSYHPFCGTPLHRSRIWSGIHSLVIKRPLERPGVAPSELSTTGLLAISAMRCKAALSGCCENRAVFPPDRLNDLAA